MDKHKEDKLGYPQGEETRAAARPQEQPTFRALGTQQQHHKTQHSGFNSAPATAQ